MSRFSPSEAALEGFRVTREHPVAVLIWAAARWALNVLTLLAFIATGGAAALALASRQAELAPDTAAARLASAAPSLGLFLLLVLACHSVIYTAILRSILRPRERGFAYMRLSLDEARQFVLALVCAALVFFAVFTLVLVATVFQAAGRLGPLLSAFLMLASAAGFVYVAVRLSLAPAMTFSERRVILFRSAALTANRFWDLAGAYVLAMLLTLVVVLLAAVVLLFIFGAIGMAEKGGISGVTAMADALRSDDETLAALLKPLRLVYLGFSALIWTLAYVLLAAPAAVIFRGLAPPAAAGAPATASGQPWG